jgi:hypothetical protein
MTHLILIIVYFPLGKWGFLCKMISFAENKGSLQSCSFHNYSYSHFPKQLFLPSIPLFVLIYKRELSNRKNKLIMPESLRSTPPSSQWYKHADLVMAFNWSTIAPISLVENLLRKPDILQCCSQAIGRWCAQSEYTGKFYFMDVKEMYT